jgi:hypothetical protein
MNLTSNNTFVHSGLITPIAPTCNCSCHQMLPLLPHISLSAPVIPETEEPEPSSYYPTGWYSRYLYYRFRY